MDVNFSGWDCTLEGGRRSARREKQRESGRLYSEVIWSSPLLRLGLRMIDGSVNPPAKPSSARPAGPFTSIDDFARRTGLGQAVVKRLADADAFGSLGTNRRQAMWQSLAQEKKPRPMPLFDRWQPQMRGARGAWL